MPTRKVQEKRNWNSPFSTLTFIHQVFTVLLICKHENSLSVCVIIQFCPNRHPISGIKKHKNRGPPPTMMNPTKPQNPLILSHSSILSPASTQNPMASIQDCRLCRCYTLMTFTPLYPIYPTQFDIRQTGFDKIPLLLCGIRHKMISAERSAAFDRCGGICYNENTKGNTADRRSAQI